MARIHAPELEDERWFPPSLRDALTGFLQVASEKTGTFDDATPILAGVLARSGLTHVVDLCAGGGGALVGMLDKLPAGTRATLTDLFPNVPAFEHAAVRTKGQAQFRASPVDATDVPADLVGVRTLFNAFHHLPPPIARGVLLDAARKKQPICVFEVVERRFATMAWLFFVPLAALVFVPFAPGLTVSRVALTYVLPVIPFAIWWDGMCSCLRGYSRAELQELIDSLPPEDTRDYTFTITQARTLPLRLTALVGQRT